MSSESTERLRLNLLSQQDRLLSQLDDLLEIKDELDAEEYEESKNETLEQILDVTASLKKLEDGNMTLTGRVESQRQVTREAISQAFRTPEVIKMFAKREPEQLKQRLNEIERDFKLGKLSSAIYQQDKRELLVAIRQLGEQLTFDQETFLAEDQTDAGSKMNFQPANENTNPTSALEWARKSGAVPEIK